MVGYLIVIILVLIVVGRRLGVLLFPALLAAGVSPRW
jgi:hypothetical protein